MPGISGRGRLTTYQGSSNSGSSMPIWRNWSASTPRLGMFLLGGWTGCLARRPGWVLSSFRNGWGSPKEQRKCYISICNAILLCRPMWKWLKLKLRVRTNKLLGIFMRGLLQSWALRRWIRIILLSLVSFKSGRDSTNVQGRYSSSDYSIYPNRNPKDYTSSTLILRRSTVARIRLTKLS